MRKERYILVMPLTLTTRTDVDDKTDSCMDGNVECKPTDRKGGVGGNIG